MSTLILGSTAHKRFQPTEHTFSYPIYMLQVDVALLEKLDQTTPFFGYNKTRLFSIYDSDYLYPDSTPISQKVRRIQEQFDSLKDISAISLVTIPRFFQKVFKPVSFYLCYSDTEQLSGMIVEVTNTYGESHLYLMNGATNSGYGPTFTVDKQFHVSPFFTEEGQYTFRVQETEHRLGIHIDYHMNGSKTFYANFVGRKSRLTTSQAMRILLFWPLTSLLIWPRIMIQAAKLYYLRRLPAFTKPKPESERTIRKMTLSRTDRYIWYRMLRSLRQCNSGCLELNFPDGRRFFFGDIDDTLQARIDISSTWFFGSIAARGEIGLGESFAKGQWDSPDPDKVIAFLIRNRHHFVSEFSGRWAAKVLNAFQHHLRRNKLSNTKANISEHYDLGNDFYSLFLDPTMSYSSGIFESPGDSLEIAQKNKVNAIINSLDIDKDSHVLEIGSGWGYVACVLAQRFGCRVTTVTLSQEQYNYVVDKICRRGLEDLVNVELRDYRTLSGSYDAIVSVEMIEAVGHDYLPIYFKICDRLLTPGGRFVLQSITYPDTEYDQYRKRNDFIRKYIFPGGHLPSVNVIRSIVAEHTALSMVKSTNIASSYAKTLSHWGHRFSEKKTELFELGFDDTFYRKWCYYFSYCEAAFYTDYLGCYQFVFEKWGED